MSANNEEATEPAPLRKCDNPHCLDGFVDQAGSNQEGTESWVDQVPCQVCSPEETTNASESEKYVALTIYPDHGEVVLRAAPDEAICRTQDHDQARLIANALNENERLREAIITHRSQKADDRCISDDDRLYEALGDGIKCDRRVGDRLEMLANCARFISRRCEAGGWPTYKQLEEELEFLKDGVRAAHAALDAAGVKREDVTNEGPVEHVTEYPVCERIKFLAEQNEKAKGAVVHILKRIKTNEKIRYHLGFGSESFDLLTTAAAALFNEPLDKVVEHYQQ